MSAIPHHRSVVVGYDGSPASRQAVEVAARHAGADGQVFVVHCFDAPPDWQGSPYADRRLAEVELRARRVLDELAADPPDALAAVTWETELLAGPAHEVLVTVARVRDAEEIVLGSRGVGRAGGLLGSVAHDVLHRADRPVLVIPERAMSTSHAPATAT